jgi:hypothetical protein
MVSAILDFGLLEKWEHDVNVDTYTKKQME